MKQYSKKIFIATFIVLLSSCSYFAPYKIPIIQGNIYEEEDLNQLQQGLTKDQVQFILGTPVIKDPFHKSQWNYYNSIQIGEKLLGQKKLTLFFDSDDLLNNWIVEDTNSSKED